MNLWRAAGGREDAPIAFLAEPGVVIAHCAAKGPNADLAAINIEGADWYVVDGFTIVGDGSMQRAGIRVTGSVGTRVTNNIVDHAYMGIFTSHSERLLVEANVCCRSTDEHGIYMGAGERQCVVRGNRLFGNQRDGLHTNADNTSANDGLLVEANVIYDNTLSGMDIEGTIHAAIRDNVIVGNRKNGIVLHNVDQPDTPPCTGNVIANNTICDNGMFGLLLAPGGNTDNVVVNNILLSSSRTYGSVCIAERPVRLRADCNVVMDRFSIDHGVSAVSLERWRAETGQDANSFIARRDELFVDANAKDFRLRPTSPAIAAGLDLRADGTFDVSPATRMSVGRRPDIGAKVPSTRPSRVETMSAAPAAEHR